MNDSIPAIWGSAFPPPSTMQSNEALCSSARRGEGVGLRNPTRCFAHVGTGGCKVTEPGLALFAALSVGSSPLDLPLAGRNGGVGRAHSLGAPRPCGRAGAEQQRVPGGSGAGRVLGTSAASRVACRYFFPPCYSFQGPSSREEHPLGCMLTVQSRERRGLAENMSGDHLSFHGGVRVAIQGWRWSARDVARKTLAHRQETGKDALQPEVDTGPRCLSLRRTAAYY